MAHQPEFRFKKSHYIHEDKVLKAVSHLQIKDKDGYWNSIPVVDEVVKLINPKDLEYYT